MSDKAKVVSLLKGKMSDGVEVLRGVFDMCNEMDSETAMLLDTFESNILEGCEDVVNTSITEDEASIFLKVSDLIDSHLKLKSEEISQALKQEYVNGK